MRCILYLILAFVALPSAAQEQNPDFLEGFPDVPLIDGVKEAHDERVIFDTPGGTVAQATLLTAKSEDVTFKTFSTALTALGWKCKAPARKLVCTREKSRLRFTPETNENGSLRIILRLEPTR